jgi:hypothetical protein
MESKNLRLESFLNGLKKGDLVQVRHNQKDKVTEYFHVKTGLFITSMSADNTFIFKRHIEKMTQFEVFQPEIGFLSLDIKLTLATECLDWTPSTLI